MVPDCADGGLPFVGSWVQFPRAGWKVGGIGAVGTARSEVDTDEAAWRARASGARWPEAWATNTPPEASRRAPSKAHPTSVQSRSLTGRSGTSPTTGVDIGTQWWA
ncbi:MAG: hypothetical protein ACHQ16_00265 [Candidatus Lutacidiplasmatales archaeon]